MHGTVFQPGVQDFGRIPPSPTTAAWGLGLNYCHYAGQLYRGPCVRTNPTSGTRSVMNLKKSPCPYMGPRWGVMHFGAGTGCGGSTQDEVLPF